MRVCEVSIVFNMCQIGVFGTQPGDEDILEVEERQSGACPKQVPSYCSSQPVGGTSSKGGEPAGRVHGPGEVPLGPGVPDGLPGSVEFTDNEPVVLWFLKTFGVLALHALYQQRRFDADVSVCFDDESGVFTVGGHPLED